MIKQFLLFVICFYSFSSSGQDFEWANTIGNDDDCAHYAIVTDNAGFIYTLSRFETTIDADPGPAVLNFTSLGIFDVLISKMTIDGDLVWARQIGGSQQQTANDLCFDNTGHLYASIGCNGTADFDPGAGVFNLTSAGINDIVVLKLDSAGNFNWAKRMGSVGYDWGNAIIGDNLGSIYLTGSFENTVDFDMGTGVANLTASGDDIFVAKYDTAGNYIWAIRFGSTTDLDEGQALNIDPAGDIYIAGNFGNTVDFNPGAPIFNLISAGSSDVFVLKLTPAGNFIWADRFGGSLAQEPYAIETDAFGYAYVTGTFFGSSDFDPGTGTVSLSSAGQTDAFIMCLTPAGALSWVKKIGTTYFDDARAIVIDAQNDIYISGSFWGTVDLDPGTGIILQTSNGSFDTYMDKFDNAGNLIWAKSWGSTFSDNSTDACLSPLDSGVLMVGGTSIGSIDMNEGAGVYTMSTPFDLNGFIHKQSWITYDSIFIINCDSDYVVPSGDETYTVAGVYNDTIDGEFGVKIILTIDLSFALPTLSNFNMIACDSYTVPSGDETYTMSGIYSDTIPNFSGCDSVMTINLTINELPVINAGSDQLVCQGTPVTLSGSGAGVGGFYTWTSGVTDGVSFNPTTGAHTYTVTGTDANGCQNTDQVSVTVNSSPIVAFTANTLMVCVGQNINFANQTTPGGGSCLWNFGDGTTIASCGTVSHGYASPGVKSVTLSVTGINGCSASMTYTNYINVYAKPTVNLGLPDTAVCASPLTLSTVPGYDSYLWSDGVATPTNVVTTSGDYWVKVTDFICQNSDTIHVEFLGTTSSISTSTCDVYTVPSGDETYFNSGIYNDTLTNMAGCDSVITINLTINDTTFSTQNFSSCESFVSPSGNYLWSSSGTYLDTILNIAGCDSIITINLTINNPTSSTQNLSACSNLISPSGNYIWTSNGTYQDTIPNIFGCDSIITINLTINNSTSSTQNLSACNNLISPSGNYVWTSTGTYNDTIPNSLGCDSIMTINLTINSADNLISLSGITLTANATGATYQWLDCNNGYVMIPGETGQSYTPVTNGNYAASITENGCTDTSDCIAISDVGLFEINESIVSVYPNPSNGKFTIVLKDLTQEKVDIQITNSLGQLVYSGTLTSSENQKEINLASGIYYLKINSGFGIETIEMIVTE